MRKAWAAARGALGGLGAALLLLAAGCGAQPASDAPGATLEQPIVGGMLDDLHTNVFGTVTHEDANTVATCSSTLIAPNLLLTARHCVSQDVSQEVICGQAGLGAPFSADHIAATNAVDFSKITSAFQAREVQVAPGGNDNCGFDVALIILNSNIPTSVATPAVPRIDRDVQTGEQYTAVGYGIADNGKAGQRRYRPGLTVFCEPGRCGSSASSGIRENEFQGETGTCEGDSGGPAFDADGKVIGVDSRGSQDCGSPVYSAVASWKDWITQVAAHAAEVGQYTPPFWVTSGMSDPPVITEPPPPVSNPKGLGESCTAQSDCDTTAACYQPDGSSSAYCVQRCSTNSDCSASETCTALSATDSVCLAPAPATRHHGCSFSATNAASSWSFVASASLALFGFAVVRRRRRAR